MKYLIILADGLSDNPIARLGNKTPVMVANTPHIDELCARGRTGLLKTVPDGFHPGSEVANLGVMGYDVRKVFEGRGVLEAASMGVKLEPGDLALRCNLICVQDGKIKNHSAGHISNDEAHQLIDFLNEKLGSDTVSFHKGVSYRHLLVIKGGDKRMKHTPPHDVPGVSFREVLPEATDAAAEPTVQMLIDLTFKSQALLEDHPVNRQRKSGGKDPANSIWPWSPGYLPKMKTYQELYGITGAVISAVDLIYGIGYYAGLEAIKVEGATGLYDTNYEGKAEAAVQALGTHDFVYLHIEASDEAGHEGDVELKIRTIEYLDKRVVKHIMNETSKMKEPVSIALLPDHPTPCELRTHTMDPVPFLIYNPELAPDDVKEYNEESVKEGYYGLLEGDQFIRTFLGK